MKGKWYNMDIHRDHLQIIGFRLNPLTWNSADGAYDAIAATLNLIKVGSAASTEAESVGSADVGEGEEDPAVIGAAVAGSICGVALLAGLVIARRRSRANEEQTRVQVTSGSWASPVLFSKKKMMDPVEPEQVTSTNPVFVQEGNRNGESTDAPRLGSDAV